MNRVTRRSALRTASASLAGAFSLPSLSMAVQSASSPYRRPQLKITDIRTGEIMGKNRQIHVRVYTDQGIIGQGEATDAVQGAVPIIQYFRSFLVGQDPLNIEAAFDRMRRDAFWGTQSGQYLAAMSGVEIALWDIAGKALGLPVYQLLGGKVRDRVRVYCDSGERELIPGSELSKARIQEIQDMKFTAAKIDIDDAHDPAKLDQINWTASNYEIEHMLEKIRFTRDLYPKGFDLAVDMHARYDATTGKRVAKEVEPFNLLWLEEPCGPENIDAMRDIRESTKTPICCGENLYLRYGFRELLEKRVADIIMPDVQKTGGILESRKIADMAQTYFVPFAPHNVCSPIGTMATAHVCAVVPNFLTVEWHWIDHLPLWKGFVKEGEVIEKGFISLPERVGLGVEMDDEFVRNKAQIPGTPWFEPVKG
jgi:galactonate dehydratase